MGKHPTSCCILISAQEKDRKGQKEHRVNNEWLKETGHAAESPSAFFFSSLQYFTLKMSCTSGIYEHFPVN